MGALGPSELIIIFLIVLLLFGSKKLPELARGLGKGIREFQKASSDIQNEIKRMDYEPKPTRPETSGEANRIGDQEREPETESDELL